MGKFLAILSVCGILSSSLAQATQAPVFSSQKIGPSVQHLFQMTSRTTGGPNIPVLVLLKIQADLSRIDDHLPKRTRGRLVYELLRKTALSTQPELVRFLQSKNVEFRQFYIQNMIAVYAATPELITELAARTDVGKIIGNTPVALAPPPLEMQLQSFRAKTEVPGANIAAVGGERVHDELKVNGANIVVAGQDTGVDWTHPALKAHYRGLSKDGTVDHNFNWHDSIHKAFDSAKAAGNVCGYELAAPCDDNEHGTHTMGTVVGDDGGTNKIGMAPGAQWIACRNMDAGVGTPASYIECFEYFLAPYALGKNALTDGNPDLSPHVINNSWGCPPEEGCEGQEMAASLTAMAKAGVMVVASAGNSGPGCSTIKDPPATSSDTTLSVGAIDHRTGQIADFSSRGPSTLDGKVGPDVSAPGVMVYSSIPGGGYGQFMWSGTSMASPHVAGEVALIWSAHPELVGKINPTVDLIRKTATPKMAKESCGGVDGAAMPNNTYGYGVIDVYKAVTLAGPTALRIRK